MAGIICLLVLFHSSLSPWLRAYCQHPGNCLNVGTNSQRRWYSSGRKVLLSMEIGVLCSPEAGVQGKYGRSIKDGHSEHASSLESAGTGASSRTAQGEMADVRCARIGRTAGGCDPCHDHLELERLGGRAG